MSTREHLHSVAASLMPVAHGVPDGAMGDPTPCTDFDVRTLANHLLGTLEAMRRVGAREPLDPQDPWGTQGEHLREDWRRDLGRRLTAFADAWAQPEAWEGEAMDGAMPRQLVGDMGLVEAMLHGWDLARATGQQVEYDAAAGERALEVMEAIGEQGRGSGAFAPEVDVPEDADAFRRALGLSGRDPEWTPR